MISKQTVMFSGLALVGMWSILPQLAFAQCSGGGGGARGPGATGSPTALASNLRSLSNPLVSNYASPTALMVAGYQRQMAMLQSQMNAYAYQNAMRQRQARQEYETQIHAARLARAEAKRARRAQRIADRLRELESTSTVSNALSLTSITNP